MLVNLPPGWDTSPDNPYAQALQDFEYGFDQIGVGQYVGLRSWAIDHLIEHEYPFSPMFKEHGTDKERFDAIQRHFDNDDPEDFGVCDEPDQVLKRWPQIETDPRPLIILFQEIRRANEPRDGGWRWHKWGRYIGTREPQCEYLAHEPEIEKVYTFHVYQVRG